MQREVNEAVDVSEWPRKDRLLDEAARQLNAKGVSLTSLIDLAATLGLSRTALYYYVKDREDLVFQCYRRSYELLASKLSDARNRGGGASRIVEALVSGMLDPSIPEVATVNEIGFLPHEHRQVVLGLYEQIVARLKSVLAEGAHAGELRQCDFDTAARTIIGVISWIPLSGYWSTATSPLTRESLAASVADLLLNGWATDRTVAVEMSSSELHALAIKAVRAYDRAALRAGRRETLLATASRLFNRNGVDTTSIEQIAAELGATKRTLYRQVGDKQTLIAECYERAYRIYIFMQEHARKYSGSRRDALASLLRDVVLAQMWEDLQPLRPTAGINALSPQARAKIVQDSVQLTAQFAALFQSAIDEGSVRAIDFEVARLVAPGASGWLTREHGSADPSRQNEIAREIALLLTIGLRAL